MAIKLSRDLKQQTTNPEGTGTSKGIDIAGTPGTNYDLDTISSGRSRTSNDVLRTQVSGNGSKVGSMSVKPSEERLFANNADMAKYLLQNEPSTEGYTPNITLRRPIVIWEEGTPDRNTGSNGEELYDTIFALEDELKRVKAEMAALKSSIITDITFYNNGDLKTDRDSIPTVGATYDFIRNNIQFNKYEDYIIETTRDNEYVLRLSNSIITDTSGSLNIGYSFSANYSDQYYDISAVDTKNNYYHLNLGGK